MDDPNFELLGDLSTEDFQQKLYHWLEERGTLSILRTYLRHQLISTLKHTQPRSTVLSRKSTHLSPKVHAINLLVADHLLAQNYYFTISILHSEEPRLGRFPTQIEPVDSYLQVKDVDDILGTLNLSSGSKLGKKVVDIYLSEKKKDKSASLLRAIFDALSESETMRNIGPKFSAGDTSSRGNRMDEDQQLFSAAPSEPEIKATNIDTSAINKLPGNKDKPELSQSYGENIKKHLMEWNQREFERRIQEEVRKVREDLEKETASQKKKFKEDVLLKQQQFLDIMNQFREQQSQVKLHLKQIQHKEEELREKESKLKETQKQETELMVNKHNDIVRAQQQLVEGFKKLNQEQNTVKYLQKEMEVWRNQVLEETIGQPPNLLQSHNMDHHSKTDGKKPQPANDNLYASDSMNIVHSLRSLQQEAIQACQQTISEVKDKNERLQTLADEQQSKINTLSLTASQLSKQLEEARAALRLLSSHDSHPSDLDPKNSIEERITVLSMMQDEKKRSREGFRRHKESMEGGSSRYRHVGGSSQRKNLRGESRKYRNHSSDSDSSSVSSPTEEIIQEARRRLERLEKESDEVDKQFFKLRQKHLAEAGGSSGLGYSDIFPGTLRESVPLYNYVPTMQNGALPVTTPYQLLQGNIALKVVDGHPDSQPYQKQDAQFLSDPVKNHPFISVPTNSNPTHPHHLIGSWQSTRAETKNGNESMPSVGGMYNNNAQKDSSGHIFRMETEGNTSNTTKTAPPSSSELPVGFEHFETNLTYKNDHRQIFQSQNDFPTKEHQRSVHFETALDKRNCNSGHIREKNHLSAMNMETEKNNMFEQLDERMLRKTNEGGTSMMADPLQLSIVDECLENNNKKVDSGSNADVDSQVPIQEATVLKTRNSGSSGEDSSSPKLSIGIDDSKEKDNSELW